MRRSGKLYRDRLQFVLAWALLACVIAGCYGTRPSKVTAEAVSLPEVRLAPGDVVEVKFFYMPELNETQTVRPDGKISLQLVGELEAQGRTPAQVQGELVRLYASELEQQTDVAVIVRSLWNRRVYVGGEVNRPGMLEMTGELTALEAIMAAEGFNGATARVSNVVVIRHRNGERHGTLLDLRDALAGKGAQPFYLAPHDIVYVPRTRIANVNRWIDQHINLVLPVGLLYTRPLGEGEIGISPPR